MPPDAEAQAKDEEKGRPKSDDDVGDTNLVDWEPNDPDNPRNFSLRFKIWITFQLGMLALAASLGSSIIAPGQTAFAEYVGISQEVSVLSISLYMYVFAP